MTLERLLLDLEQEVCWLGWATIHVPHEAHDQQPAVAELLAARDYLRGVRERLAALYPRPERK